VERYDVNSFRIFDVCQDRFGRTNNSQVYEDTIKNKDWKVLERDWSQGFSEKTKSRYGPGQAYGPEAGCMYQLFVALKAKDKDGVTRHFGTLTVSFKNKPKNKDNVERIMKEWAERGDYIDYLTKTIGFELGGLRC